MKKLESLIKVALSNNLLDRIFERANEYDPKKNDAYSIYKKMKESKNKLVPSSQSNIKSPGKVDILQKNK